MVGTGDCRTFDQAAARLRRSAGHARGHLPRKSTARIGYRSAKPRDDVPEPRRTVPSCEASKTRSWRSRQRPNRYLRSDADLPRSRSHADGRHLAGARFGRLQHVRHRPEPRPVITVSPRSRRSKPWSRHLRPNGERRNGQSSTRNSASACPATTSTWSRSTDLVPSTASFGCSSRFTRMSTWVDLLRQRDVWLTALREAHERGETVPFPVHNGQDPLLPWAITDNGDVCYWLMDSLNDSNSWDVAVNEAGGDAWHKFEGSASDFLAAVLSGSSRVALFAAGFPSEAPTLEAGKRLTQAGRRRSCPRCSTGALPYSTVSCSPERAGLRGLGTGMHGVRVDCPPVCRRDRQARVRCHAAEEPSQSPVRPLAGRDGAEAPRCSRPA